jgi:hypothetical protein
MAIVCTASNKFKYELAKKLIDLSADTIKIILMNNTFAFDKDTHHYLADVTADQLPTNYGYTQDNKELENKVVTEDDTNDKCSLTCDDVTWTAASGAIGPSGAACLVDTTRASGTIIGCIDFGTDYTIPDGSSFQLQDIEVDIT